MRGIRNFVRALFALVVLACLSRGAAADTYRVGVARADVTPEGPIRMAGYGNRNKPSEGVEHPLALKALAVQHAREPALLLITADIIGFPRTVAEAIAGRIDSELKVPRANVLLVA